MRDNFNADLIEILAEVHGKLEDIMQKCSTDLRQDFELVSGEEIPHEGNNLYVQVLFDTVEEVQRKREEILGSFELETVA
jgi:hypothetical protein